MVYIKNIQRLVLSSLDLPLSFSSTTNREFLSQCSVDENDLKLVTNEKEIALYLNNIMKIVVLKSLGVGKQDALMHREGLNG